MIMDKEFESWWTINKFRLMENDDVGVREIALAAYVAGRQTAQQNVQPTVATGCPFCGVTAEDIATLNESLASDRNSG